MAQQIPNIFTTYALSESEFHQGSSLPALTVCVIHNLIAEKATEKINLRFDPLNPAQFQQAEAELQGQIGILRHLLDQSDISLEQLNVISQTQG